jgi:hypothetical protein
LIIENHQRRASDIRRQPARASTDGQCGLNGRGFKVKRTSAKCEGSCDRREQITARIRMFSSVKPKTIAAASFWSPLGNAKGEKESCYSYRNGFDFPIKFEPGKSEL